MFNPNHAIELLGDVEAPVRCRRVPLVAPLGGQVARAVDRISISPVPERLLAIEEQELQRQVLGEFLYSFRF